MGLGSNHERDSNSTTEKHGRKVPRWLALKNLLPGRKESAIPDPGVDRVREEFLIKLQERVSTAARAAPVMKLTPDQRSTVEYIEEARREREILENLPSGTTNPKKTVTDQPWEVLLSDATYYLDLLRMGHSEIFTDHGRILKRGDIETYAREDYEHELFHAAAALEDPNLKVRYGISILELHKIIV